MNKLKTIGACLCMLAAGLVPSVAMAQSGVNLQRDAGDNIVNGEVVGDDTPDCATAADVMESGLCAPGSSLNEDPSTLEDVPDYTTPASVQAAEKRAEVANGLVPSSATASASASATASAAAEQYTTPAEDQYVAPPSEAEGTLPDTGGALPLALVIGALLLIGGIIVASKLYLSKVHN